jgi:hypothetical protein
MRTHSRYCTVAAVGAVSFALASVAGPAAAAPPPSGRPLSTVLTGAAEVPGPGDPDATGTASLRVNPGLEQLCFELTAAGIDGDLTGAHVHVGSVTEAGPVVVPLAAPVEGSSSGCVTVDRELAVAIVSDPASYYVNVHSTVFPAGAIRGQLG